MMNDPDSATYEAGPEIDPVADGQLMIDDRPLAEDGYRAPRPHPVLDLVSPRVAELAKTALELRMADLQGLAKKNLAEGYPGASRTQMVDARVIKSDLLPQLEGQLSLANTGKPAAINELATKAFQRTIENSMRRVWELARASKTDQPSDLLIEVSRQLSDILGVRVAEFAFEFYALSYEAGLSERLNTFERLAANAASRLG
jgi:hypothetical protein